jgi:hypothetical protein
MKKGIRYIALAVFVFLFFAACAAEKVEDDESAFLAKYAQLMLDEQRLHSTDVSKYSAFDVASYKCAKIETKDQKVFYEVVFPKKGETDQSYVVTFQEDFATKFVRPVSRGFAGNADDEITKFKAYQGKIMDLGDDG